jgi:hypothetical protein
MREALVVAMHDPKTMIWSGGRENQLLAAHIAPGHQTVFQSIEKIECQWKAWGNVLAINLTMVKGDGRTFSIDYQGSYTVIFAPEPPAQEPEGVFFGGTAFEGSVIRDWVEKQEQ